MHILIVDDDDDIREVLTVVLLQADGHWVEVAADGLEALDRLRRGGIPSLILLDLMMPRLDGESFMKVMASDSRLAHIPVCILTGHQDAQEKALRLGAVGYLVKPIELEQLTAMVHAVASQDEARV